MTNLTSRNFTIDQIVEAVIASLTDELRLKKYQGSENKLFGHCYVASEAVYWLNSLVGPHHELSVYHMRWENDSHWFLFDHNLTDIIDPTAGQFKEEPMYETRRRRFFLTTFPSKRAQEVIGRAMTKLESERYGLVLSTEQREQAYKHSHVENEREYECYNCHDQGCYQCMSPFELLS